MTSEEKMERDEMAKGYVRSEKLGQMLGISQRHILRLRADGALVTESTEWGQRYHLVKSLIACVKYYMNKQDTQSEKQRAQAAEADYKEKKAEMIDIELRKRKGEVHEARHIRELINGMIIEMKAAFLAIPARIAMSLLQCRNANETSEIVRNALCEVMEDLASHEYDPEKFRRLVDEDGDINALQDDDDEEETEPQGKR